MTRPPLALPPSGLPFLPMLPRRRPTTLYACGIFARQFLLVVSSSPLAVWAGCLSLLCYVRLWITGTNVVEWNSRRVTRSIVPRFEVLVVMITLGYALAPLTGTPEPANARENPGQSVLHSSDWSMMLRSEIQSEIFDLPVPSHHGKERQKEERNYSLFSCPIPPVPKMHLLRPRKRLLCQPGITALTRTAALSPFHNVRAIAHKFKFEWPFEVPYTIFDRERGGRLPSVLAPAAVPLEPPPFWSQRVLNDLPLTVKKVGQQGKAPPRQVYRPKSKTVQSSFENTYNLPKKTANNQTEHNLFLLINNKKTSQHIQICANPSTSTAFHDSQLRVDSSHQVILDAIDSSLAANNSNVDNSSIQAMLLCLFSLSLIMNS
ncbi:hypothetical protein Tco_0519833 [Tanacetum coccineum]